MFMLIQVQLSSLFPYLLSPLRIVTPFKKRSIYSSFRIISTGVANDDSEDEDNSTFLPEHESPNLDHQDNPSSPRPPPEPPDVCLNFKPDTAMKNDGEFNQGEIILSLNVEDVNSFTFVIWTFLPCFTLPESPGVFNGSFLFQVLLSLRTNEFRDRPSKCVEKEALYLLPFFVFLFLCFVIVSGLNPQSF
ncbi:hypothetical protein Tco_0828236 [Tanacetum coccineum]